MINMSSMALIEAAFVAQFGQSATCYSAPGRINIIGEHLDYNGGCVIPAALDRYTWVAAGRRNDRRIKAHFLHEGHDYLTDLDQPVEARPSTPESYLLSMLRTLKEASYSLVGCNLVIGGNLPLGSGLSSSASLSAALGLALLDQAGHSVSAMQLAKLSYRSETGYVGVRCGIMDQMAVALANPGHATWIDCASLEYSTLPMPRAACFVLAHCGRSRKLSDGSYNRRREECEAALARIQTIAPDYSGLASLSPSSLEHYRALLGPELYDRAYHVSSEAQRVNLARDALLSGDDQQLGQLMNESHASLRDRFKVSCEELDHTVDLMLGLPGTIGARMMGAGFGGCAIALVRNESASEMADALQAKLQDWSGKPHWLHVAGDAQPCAHVAHQNLPGMRQGAKQNAI